MLYKGTDEIIYAVSTDDRGTIQYDPKYAGLLEDESIPWRNTDKTIYRLSDNSFVFGDDSRVLVDLKKIKWANVKTSFNERVSGAVTTSLGYSMQFETSDSIKMQGAIQLLEASGATEGYLTQANDETIYNIPLATMKAVLIEMMSAYAACHARKQELRALINAAQTAEELDEIVISWPV